MLNHLISLILLHSFSLYTSDFLLLSSISLALTLFTINLHQTSFFPQIIIMQGQNHDLFGISHFHQATNSFFLPFWPQPSLLCFWDFISDFGSRSLCMLVTCIDVGFSFSCCQVEAKVEEDSRDEAWELVSHQKKEIHGLISVDYD